MEYITTQQASEKWEVSTRLVQRYCKEGRIHGAKKMGRTWVVPENANKPTDIRLPLKNNEDGLEQKVYLNLHNSLVSYDKAYQKIGAIIAAAGVYDTNKGISPYTNLGEISLITRIVLSFQNAGISRIVVVTGYQHWELEHHLKDYGVIFLYNDKYSSCDKFKSIQMGLEFLKDKCDKIFFTSLQIPLFTSETLRLMCESDYAITIPSYKGRNGHPVLIDKKAINSISSYVGDKGLRGAINNSKFEKTYLEVDDEGVLLSANNIDKINDVVSEHNSTLLHAFIRLSIEREVPFFDGRSKMLLFLINEFNSVSTACKQMALSQSKAWNMIKQMETILGFKVLDRKRGGARDRKTVLTENGKNFLKFYTKLEQDINAYAQEQFLKGIYKMISDNK